MTDELRTVSTNRKSTVVIMPRAEVKVNNLYEAIVAAVGKPKWTDIIDNGHTRMKWSEEFPIDAAVKVKEILNTYPDWMIIHFNPAYSQTAGKIGGRFGVIKFCVHPVHISYPYKQAA